MKYAKSLRYGGELIAAKDCDYKSFQKLLPLCPECSEPVHLRKGGNRTSSTGKSYEVATYWSHFKSVSAEQKASCEARVDSYSEVERQKIASKARGQRLRWLNQYFWQVWTSVHLPAGADIATYEYVKNIPTLQFESRLIYEANILSLMLRKEENLAANPFREMLEAIARGQQLALIRDDKHHLLLGELQVDFYESIEKGLDLHLHSRYCWEVLSFLCTARSRPILSDILAFSVHSILESCVAGMLPKGVPSNLLLDSKKGIDTSKITIGVADSIFVHASTLSLGRLAITPWSEIFQRETTVGSIGILRRRTSATQYQPSRTTTSDKAVVADVEEL